MSAKRTQSAISAGVTGSTPAYTAFAASASPRKRTSENSLDEPRVDRRDPDRTPEEVFAEGIYEAAQAELAATYEAAFCMPAARRRPHEHDVALVRDAVAHPRHAQDAVDVGVQHRLLVFGIRLPERVAAEREARVAEEDVDDPEFRRSLPDERGGALLVGHVERQREVRLDPLDAPRAAQDGTPDSRSFLDRPRRRRSTRP